MASFFETFFGGSRVSAKEYVDACQERRSFLATQLAWLQSEKKQHEDEAERLGQSLERIRQETVGYLLPEVKTPYLESLEQRLRYPGLLAIKEKYDTQFQASETRQAEVEAMDEIQHFDFHMNQVLEGIKDLQPGFDSTSSRYGIWTQNVHFKSLHQRGFFKLDDKPSWWRKWQNWRSVSLLMGRLSRQGIKMKTPSEVKNEFRLLHDQFTEIHTAYQRRIGERDHLNKLKQELAELIATPERLLSELYRELGEAVLAHLRACPTEVRVELAKSDPYLNTFFRKELGTQKQSEYLREIGVVRIGAQSHLVEQDLEKLDYKIRKLKLQLARGKRKVYTDQQLAQVRDFKQEKWEKRRVQCEDVRNRITHFHHHDHGSFLTQYLWWDLISGGLDGSDLFEVRQFRSEHPEWSRKEYVDPIQGVIDSSALDGAADALAADMATPDGNLFQDVS